MWLGGRCVRVWGGRRKRSLVGILENGENPEIRKMRNNKQKYTKPEVLKHPVKCGKTKESQKAKTNKIENKTVQAKACTNWRRGA